MTAGVTKCLTEATLCQQTAHRAVSIAKLATRDMIEIDKSPKQSKRRLPQLCQVDYAGATFNGNDESDVDEPKATSVTRQA